MVPRRDRRRSRLDPGHGTSVLIRGLLFLRGSPVGDRADILHLRPDSDLPHLEMVAAVKTHDGRSRENEQAIARDTREIGLELVRDRRPNGFELVVVDRAQVDIEDVGNADANGADDLFRVHNPGQTLAYLDRLEAGVGGARQRSLHQALDEALEPGHWVHSQF